MRIELSADGRELVIRMPLSEVPIPFEILAKKRKAAPKRDYVENMVLNGFSNSEIAQYLGISINGVKCHVANILKHYGVTNRRELILLKARAEHEAADADSSWIASQRENDVCQAVGV